MWTYTAGVLRDNFFVAKGDKVNWYKRRCHLYEEDDLCWGKNPSHNIHWLRIATSGFEGSS